MEVWEVQHPNRRRVTIRVTILDSSKVQQVALHDKDCGTDGYWWISAIKQGPTELGRIQWTRMESAASILKAEDVEVLKANLRHGGFREVTA